MKNVAIENRQLVFQNQESKASECIGILDMYLDDDDPVKDRLRKCAFSIVGASNVANNYNLSPQKTGRILMHFIKAVHIAKALNIEFNFSVRRRVAMAGPLHQSPVSIDSKTADKLSVKEMRLDKPLMIGINTLLNLVEREIQLLLEK